MTALEPIPRSLHVIPRAYHLDGRRRIGNPSGVRGNLLEMETHVIVGAIQRINLLVRSVQDAGIKVKGLVLEPLASSEAVLSRQERELGVVLADIGGGSTDVAAFTDGSIWYTSVIPVGGNHITSDLATGLDVDFQQAEEIKLMYGHALPEEVDPLEMVSLNSASQQRRSTVSRQEICQIIRARVEETLELIFDMIEKAELEAGPAAGIVLTGGTAKLPGIETLAQQILKMPVRVGRPQSDRWRTRICPGSGFRN